MTAVFTANAGDSSDELALEGLDWLLALRVVHVNVDSDLLARLEAQLLKADRRSCLRGADSGNTSDLGYERLAQLRVGTLLLFLLGLVQVESVISAQLRDLILDVGVQSLVNRLNLRAQVESL